MRRKCLSISEHALDGVAVAVEEGRDGVFIVKSHRHCQVIGRLLS